MDDHGLQLHHRRGQTTKYKGKKNILALSYYSFKDNTPRAMVKNQPLYKNTTQQYPLKKRTALQIQQHR